jgi:hypothetical protein
MSARDVIMHVAFRETYEGKARDLRDAMDAFAHELAEETRERAAEIVGVGPYSLGILSVINEALKSIDPKVKK